MQRVVHVRQHRRARCLGGRRSGREEINAHAEDRERVLHLVRDARRQLADGLHFLHLDDLELGLLEPVVHALQVRQSPQQVLPAAGQVGVRPLQLLLGAHPRRDIPENTLRADDLAVRVEDRRLHHLDVFLLAAGRRVLLDGLKEFPRRDDALVVSLILGRQLGGKEVGVRAPNDFIEGLAQFHAEAAVGEGEPALHVLAEDVLREVLDQRLVKRLRVPQRPLDALALNRIAHRAVQQHLVHLALHEIILRAVMHGGLRDPFVVQPAHHDDGQLRVQRLELRKRVQPAAVTKEQVQQHEVERHLRRGGDALAQAGRVRHCKRVAQQRADEQRVGGAVFDEEHARDRGRTRRSQTGRLEGGGRDYVHAGFKRA